MFKIRKLIKLALLGGMALGISQGAQAAGPAPHPGYQAGAWGPQPFHRVTMRGPAHRAAAPRTWRRPMPSASQRGWIGRPGTSGHAWRPAYPMPTRFRPYATPQRPVARAPSAVQQRLPMTARAPRQWQRPPMQVAQAPRRPMAIPGPYPVQQRLPMTARAPRQWQRPPMQVAQAPRRPMAIPGPYPVQQRLPMTARAPRQWQRPPMTMAQAPRWWRPAPQQARAPGFRPMLAGRDFPGTARPFNRFNQLQLAKAGARPPVPGPYRAARDLSPGRAPLAGHGNRPNTPFEAAFGAAEMGIPPAANPG